MGKIHPKKNILIIRVTAIGDIVMANPVASAIKQQNPNANISWLVDQAFTPLLKSHPHVDQLIPINTKDWQELWRKKHFWGFFKKYRELSKTLRQLKFDLVLDLQGNAFTSYAAYMTGAKQRVALGSDNINHWFVNKTISRNLGEHVQMGSEYRYLVSQLGYSDSNWRMHVPDSIEAREKAQELLSSYFEDQPYAVICPFSAHPQKNWVNAYWQQIILRIRGRYKLRTVIVGGHNGVEAGNEIAKATGAINLAGKTSLKETAAIIRGAALLIGVDTGLTHIGHAVDTPTISLFGATSPYTYVGNDASKIIYLDRYCSPCKRHPTCNKQYQCMKDITPDIVLTAIKPLMLQSRDL
ncbi:Lipopolysaccharide heptosyltransferase 1 [Thalassocella blandensis]|nr:Lipopolysaccharide heptosyltransferase 1 [Thalassocella blandensis]